jgi:dipeptidyl aminopeptidase/acylaminoacyl peptidase
MSLFTRATALAVATIAALVVVPQTASATLPGANGRIAFSVFVGSDEIFTMNPDGTDQRQVTDTAGDNFDPDWSPTGAKFAFSSTREITATNVYTMNADGSNQVRLTGPGGANLQPSWSPDGTKIVYVSAGSTGRALFTMNADGTNKTQITAVFPFVSEPAWSPDGTSIAFSLLTNGNTDIYRVKPNGTGLTRLTNAPASDDSPTWSPDGTKIAFGTLRDGGSRIYTMNADGTAQVRLTNNATPDYRPAWSPDGKKIAFNRAGGSVWDMYVINATGSGETKISDTAGSGVAWQSIPQLTVPGVSAVEGTSATVTVQLNRAMADPVTVTISTGGGSAAPGQDYVPVTVTRTFAPFTTTVTMAVTILDDTIDELNETIGISVSGSTVAPAGGTLTIADNDPPPQVSVADKSVLESGGSVGVGVSLDRPSSRPVTVTVTTGGGTATPGSDYQPIQVTFSIVPFTTSATVSVPIINDTAAEPTETFGITLTDPVNATIGDGTATISILDNDTPMISIDDLTIDDVPVGVPVTALVTVRLSLPASQPVTVDYATADGTATGGIDYVRTRNRLTFQPGQLTRTFEVQVTSDGDGVTFEQFFVNLTDPVGAPLADPQGVVTIRDCVTICSG